MFPYWLSRYLPLFDYLCPRCRKEVKKNSHECPSCGEKYPLPLRVPPELLKNLNTLEGKKALEAYVHKHVFPRVSEFERNYLTKYFTVIFSSGWENSGGADITDGGMWDGVIVDAGCTAEVVSTQHHHGTYAAHFFCLSGNTQANVYKYLDAAHDTLCVRFYLKLAIVQYAWEGILLVHLTGASAAAALRIRGGGGAQTTLSVYDYAVASYYDSAEFTSALDTWYCVEMQFHSDATVGWFKALWNGVTKVDQSGLDTGTNQMNLVQLGMYFVWNQDEEIYVDCVVVADTRIGCERRFLPLTRNMNPRYQSRTLQHM